MILTHINPGNPSHFYPLLFVDKTTSAQAKSLLYANRRCFPLNSRSPVDGLWRTFGPPDTRKRITADGEVRFVARQVGVLHEYMKGVGCSPHRVAEYAALMVDMDLTRMEPVHRLRDIDLADIVRRYPRMMSVTLKFAPALPGTTIICKLSRSGSLAIDLLQLTANVGMTGDLLAISSPNLVATNNPLLSRHIKALVIGCSRSVTQTGNVLLNYISPARTSGIIDWRLLEKLVAFEHYFTPAEILNLIRQTPALRTLKVAMKGVNGGHQTRADNTVCLAAVMRHAPLIETLGIRAEHRDWHLELSTALGILVPCLTNLKHVGLPPNPIIPLFALPASRENPYIDRSRAIQPFFPSIRPITIHIETGAAADVVGEDLVASCLALFDRSLHLRRHMEQLSTRWIHAELSVATCGAQEGIDDHDEEEEAGICRWRDRSGAEEGGDDDEQENQAGFC